MKKWDKKILPVFIVVLVIGLLYRWGFIGTTLVWLLMVGVGGYVLDEYINEKTDELLNQINELKRRVDDIEKLK